PAARGIGKGTIDTLEQLALGAGLSLWGAIREAVKRQLVPPRAVSSLKNFQQLIEDARAMLSGTFSDQLQESAAPEAEVAVWGQPPKPDLSEGEGVVGRGEAPPASAAGDTAFDAEEFENFSFDFGQNAVTSSPEDGKAPSLPDRQPEAGATPGSETENAIDPATASFPVPSVSTADI